MCIHVNIDNKLIKHSSTSSDLTAPDLPAGFATNFVWDDKTLMNPIQVYVNAIKLMTLWAVLPWESYIRTRQRMTHPRFTTEIETSPWTAGLTSELQIKHAVSGLYQAGVAIAGGNKFHRVAVGLIERSQIIGQILFQPTSTAANDVVDLVESNFSSTAALSANAGSAIDPLDPNFKLLYEFDGVLISSVEAFTAVLDGLATAAEHEKDAVGAFVNAYSVDYKCTINIHGTIGHQLNWYHVIRALFLVWLAVYKRAIAQRPSRFEGMDFTLEYDGVKIGEGDLWKFTKLSNGTDSTAISK